MKKILSGKQVSKEIIAKVKQDVENLKKENITPHLTIIQVGADSASKYYAKSIIKNCQRVGIRTEFLDFSSDIEQKFLIKKIGELNDNPQVHAIQIMMPLPEHISTDCVMSAISPNKDVDCLNPLNVGKLVLGKNTFLPNTPAGVLELLKYYNIETDGKKIAILGRSNIVGKPLANLLIQKTKTGNGTITICHSHTKNLAKITTASDILIVAIGKPQFITEKYVSKDTIVIDVGINRILDKDTNRHKYVGDVDFDAVKSQVAAITPVPGGIGSITTAALLANISKATQKLISEKK
ncbi:MAG: bifunctional 5,10-methylene-tetrahydrofolate dehydrogenase/5,10-methylene-tetrahydrofolate cyclohydrolase [Candidatus Cloacimonetes bacterium]|nr:bifunctional 5,10-methylene-tetrahydrofolate dehydrogenase/5,10-methylene-tetrahydrofolate cyclohydrolase [Candidatus Cloacimonadota bacterium]MBS3767234.1 bifunctional 5,10-methylene-tetrahydrofolate dehydrogenase/5,10-methylene-tetrahydrofolate cyclohydrolase [Candidatus Cloacimonadota bacterium]